MKICYSSLTCPHCGSGKFRLIKQDIFECDYCGENFNINIEDIDFTSENKGFIEDLKNEFTQKTEELHEEIIRNRIKLKTYSGLANRQKAVAISAVCLAISVLLIFAYAVIGVITGLISAAFLIFSLIKRKKDNEKYQPIANEYAKKIVEIETQINYYDSLVGKLNKSA